MGTEALTVPLAENAKVEEEASEAIVDEAFLPTAPLSVLPAAYNAASTYAKGEYVTEGGVYYRSQQAGNKAHTPSADADFEWWSPVAETAIVLLQNPSFGHTPSIVEQRSYSEKPPASSAVAVAALETIAPGNPVPVEIG